MWGCKPIVLDEKKECIKPCPICGAPRLASTRMVNFFFDSCENCYLEYAADGYQYYYIKHVKHYPGTGRRLKISPDGEKEWI